MVDRRAVTCSRASVSALCDAGHFVSPCCRTSRLSRRLLAVLPINPSADVRQSIADIAPDLEAVRADADVPPPAEGCHGLTEEVGDLGDGEQAVLVVHGRVLSLDGWRLRAVIGDKWLRRVGMRHVPAFPPHRHRRSGPGVRVRLVWAGDGFVMAVD